MKRQHRRSILSVVLMLAMCASAMLTSCDALSASKVTRDPSSAVATAIRDTVKSLYGDSNILNVVYSAIMKGSVTYTTETPDYDTAERVTLYTDVEAGALALEMSSTDEYSDDQTVCFYSDGKSCAIQSPLINGGKAVGTDITKLPDSLENSAIFSLFGMTYEDFSELFKKDSNDDNSIVIARFIRDFKDLIDSADVSVSADNADIFGTSEKAITVTYSLDSEDLGNAATLVNNLFEKILQDYTAEAPDLADIEDLTVSFVLNPENGMLMKASFAPASGNAEATLTLGANPADSEQFTLNVTDDENKTTACVIERSESDGVLARSLSVTESDGTNSSIVFTYDKASGDFTLNTSGGDTAAVNGEYSGKLVCTDDSLELTLPVEASDFTPASTVTVTFKVGGEVSAVPEYDDIAGMDEETLCEALFGSIGGGYGGSYDEFDYTPYLTYDPAFDYDADGDAGDSDDYATWEIYNQYYNDSFNSDFSNDYDYDYDYDYDNDYADEM